jgi:hypothetical protein
VYAYHNWISACRRLKLGSCFSPCTKINSKWIKDFNISPETLKQLQEAIGNTLAHIGIGNNFLNRTPKAQHLRETMNKWDYIKLNSFCTAKERVTRLKRQLIEWGKIFSSYSSDKGLISRICRELKKFKSQRINTPVKKWAHELNREFSKEEVQMTSKYMQKCSTSLVIKEMQIKTTLRFHPTPDRMAIIQSITNAVEDGAKQEPLCSADGNTN